MSLPSLLSRKTGKKKMRISSAVYQAIESTVGCYGPETGAMLGGSRKDGVVRQFHFDDQAQRTNVSYSPHFISLNAILREQWNPRDVNLLGFVHSHPGWLKKPSGGDLIYAKKILDHNPELNELWMPIVIPIAETGHFKIYPFVAVRDGDGIRIEKCALELVDDAGENAEETQAVEPATHILKQNGHAERRRQLERDANGIVPIPVDDLPSVNWSGPATPFSLDTTFQRVKEAYDLPRMATSRVIAIGAGGAAACLEDLARAGIGEFCLIDPDVTSETNIATQQVYRRDLHRPKVECLKERILDINPQALVVTRQQRLEEIGDSEFAHLATAPWRKWAITSTSLWGVTGLDVPAEVVVPPAVTFMGLFTDSFTTQARGNRLGLHFGLPTLSAQVYHEGRGGEITFTYPGVTPACHRCALRSRYAAHLNGEYRNDVTSDGTPIFATSRLNALKGMIALALLHHGTNHPRWGGLLKRIGNRNLIQIRMDPDLLLPVFDRVLGGGDRERILFDDVVWLPQLPDCPANGFPTCPDCGGTGNLLDARGTFQDTLEMRK